MRETGCDDKDVESLGGRRGWRDNVERRRGQPGSAWYSHIFSFTPFMHPALDKVAIISHQNQPRARRRRYLE